MAHIDPAGTEYVPPPVTWHGEYNPGLLIIRIQEVLGDAGIGVDITSGMYSSARLAAADLLRALGVKPVVAPVRAYVTGVRDAA